MSSTALLTFSIGPVHAFIAQARRVADLWTGSDLLSHLMGEAIEEACRRDGDAIFPEVSPGKAPPRGLPNRVVCRVPAGTVEVVAHAMESRVRGRWNDIVSQAVDALHRKQIVPAPEIWSEDTDLPRQTDPVFEVSWSWVAEEGTYADASRSAAERFIASRLFRPFRQIGELGEKCAICGERTALPDGDRRNVRRAWEAAEKSSESRSDQRFFRLDQTRLCLVCAAKRLYSLSRDHDKGPYFSGFDEFQPPDSETAYFALVAMDGDHMGDILTWSAERVAGGKLEAFHRAVSRSLSAFSESLRRERPWVLNLDGLGLSAPAGKWPQLVYAGGEDVVLVCDPRDALPIARAIRRRYLQELETVRPLLADPTTFDRSFTISAAILFAHAKHPAGLVFRDVDELLKRKAKTEAGRDAVALSLVKRSGVPTEVAFKWQEGERGEPGWVERFDELVAKLAEGELSSRQSYNLREEETVLRHVFGTDERRWRKWLADRLTRSEIPGENAAELARMLAPFFVAEHVQALRIARFLGREVVNLPTFRQKEVA